jgi:hypothetical protein
VLQVPILTHDNAESISANTLVRFRGMVSALSLHLPYLCMYRWHFLIVSQHARSIFVITSLLLLLVLLLQYCAVGFTPARHLSGCKQPTIVSQQVHCLIKFACRWLTCSIQSSLWAPTGPQEGPGSQQHSTQVTTPFDYNCACTAAASGFKLHQQQLNHMTLFEQGLPPVHALVRV